MCWLADNSCSNLTKSLEFRVLGMQLHHSKRKTLPPKLSYSSRAELPSTGEYLWFWPKKKVRINFLKINII